MAIQRNIFVVKTLCLALSLLTPFVRALAGDLVIHEVFDGEFPKVRLLCSPSKATSLDNLKIKIEDQSAGSARVPAIIERIETPPPREFIFVLDNRFDLFFSADIFREAIKVLARECVKRGERVGIVEYGLPPNINARMTQNQGRTRFRTLVMPTLDIPQIENGLERFALSGDSDDFWPALEEARRIANDGQQRLTQPAHRVIVAFLHSLPEATVKSEAAVVADAFVASVFCVLPERYGVFGRRRFLDDDYIKFLEKTGGAAIPIRDRRQPESYTQAFDEIRRQLDEKCRWVTFESAILDVNNPIRKCSVHHYASSGSETSAIKLTYRANVDAVRRELGRRVRQADLDVGNALKNLDEYLREARAARQSGNMERMRAFTARSQTGIAQAREAIRYASNLRQNDGAYSMADVKTWEAKLTPAAGLYEVLNLYISIADNKVDINQAWQSMKSKWTEAPSDEARAIANLLVERTVERVREKISQKNIEEALALTSGAQQGLPGDYQELLSKLTKLRGDALQAAGRKQEARKQYESALPELRTDVERVDVLYHLAVLDIEEGSLRQAAARLEGLSKLDPRHEKGMKLLLALYLGNDDYEKVILNAQNMAAIRPLPAEIEFYVAAAHYLAGDRTEATKALQNLLQRPDNQRKAETMDLLGRLAYDEGSWSRGLLWMRRARETDSNVNVSLKTLNPKLVAAHPLDGHKP